MPEMPKKIKKQIRNEVQEEISSERSEHQQDATQCIIYARFSPRPTDKHGSIESQLEICKNYALEAGWVIREFYEDSAKSGNEIERDGLWQAINALGLDDILLVYRLNRLARDTYLMCLIERECEKKGARIVSSQGEGTGDQSAEGKLIRQILQALAEYERKIISARVKSGMKRKQKEGWKMGSIPPYGWQADPDNDKRWIRNEYEMEAKKEMIRMWRYGFTYREIVEWIFNSFEDNQVRCSVKVVYNIINEHKKLNKIGKYKEKVNK